METKKGKKTTIFIIILIVLVLGLAGYIGYDKLLAKKDNEIKEEANKKTTKEKKVSKEKQLATDDKTSESKQVKNGTVTTRSCIGTYSGQAAIAMDAQTGKPIRGTLTIELKEDGSFLLTKENGGGEGGSYTIVENALLLKIGPHTCGSPESCKARYGALFFISDDCSTINGGYTGLVFEPDFVLKKQ